LLTKCDEKIKTKLLRILCILSITNCGIPKEKYIDLTKAFIQAYGPMEIIRLSLLEKFGFLKQKKSDSWDLVFFIFSLCF